MRWRLKHLPRVVPRHRVDGIVGVVDAIKAGLGVEVVPVFMLAQEPMLRPLAGPLEGCESQLRRIAAVYQHLAEAILL